MFPAAARPWPVGVHSRTSHAESPVPARWAAIDALVQDIGELSAEVHLAERTLSTDPRTQAARVALDRATEAVCAAIDDSSEAAVARAAAAIVETRLLIGPLGLTLDRGRALAEAARTLRTAKDELPRLAARRQRWKRLLSKD
jgi:hypothetical protein